MKLFKIIQNIAKSVVVSFICQLIFFVYLLDKDTSWMVVTLNFGKVGKTIDTEVYFVFKILDHLYIIVFKLEH